MSKSVVKNKGILPEKIAVKKGVKRKNKNPNENTSQNPTLVFRSAFHLERCAKQKECKNFSPKEMELQIWSHRLQKDIGAQRKTKGGLCKTPYTIPIRMINEGYRLSQGSPQRPSLCKLFTQKGSTLLRIKVLRHCQGKAFEKNPNLIKVL